MKRLLVLLSVGLVLLTACGAPALAPPTSPPNTPQITPTPTPMPTTTPQPEAETPLKYRELDSFTTEAVKDLRGHAAMLGYDLPEKIVEWPYFAVYVVVQNLDDVSGTFEVNYTLSTADKEAAERQQFLTQRTPDDYAELKREFCEGNIKLDLEPHEVGVAICPLDGIYISTHRVPFSHEHEITPSTKAILK